MEAISDPCLVFYLPLWKLNGTQLMSRSASGQLCDVSGAKWRHNGRYFDGTNDLIDCGNLGTTARTLSFWFKPASTTEDILEETAGVGVSINATVMVYANWDKCYIDGEDTDTTTADWHSITLTSTTGVDISAFRLGLVNLTYYEGIIGEVAIYTRTLTPQEIQGIYLATRFRYR